MRQSGVQRQQAASMIPGCDGTHEQPAGQTAGSSAEQMVLYRRGHIETQFPTQPQAGLLWIYAVRHQSLSLHTDRSQLAVPPNYMLVSAHPPFLWSLSTLEQDDLVLRLPIPAAHGPMVPEPGLVLTSDQSQVVRHLMEALRADEDAARSRALSSRPSHRTQGDVPNGTAESASLWRAHARQAFIAFLVLVCPPLPRPATASGIVPARDQRRLDRMNDYMAARLGAPVSSEDLAKAAGVSIRALNALCQRHYLTTPMELLRRLRLEAVHRHLKVDPESPIGDVALRFGFGHLGRFSAYYRERFAELPHETRLRHLGQRTASRPAGTSAEQAMEQVAGRRSRARGPEGPADVLAPPDQFS